MLKSYKKGLQSLQSNAKTSCKRLCGLMEGFGVNCKFTIQIFKCNKMSIKPA